MKLGVSSAQRLRRCPTYRRESATRVAKDTLRNVLRLSVMRGMDAILDGSRRKVVRERYEGIAQSCMIGIAKSTTLVIYILSLLQPTTVET